MTRPTALSGFGPASARDADRCPGMLRPHRAADGAVVRIRLIGGLISTVALAAVGSAARRYGDGTVTLTSRGNLQLRGLTVDDHGDADPGLVDAIAAAGLLPSRSHERVRNVLVSPLTGIADGHADVRALAQSLDEMLCNTPELAGLSGRFLFGLDDGRGDLSDQSIDLGATALDAATTRLRIGPWWGPSIPKADTPSALVALARRFLSLPGSPWRITDLAQRGRELLPPGLPLEAVRPQTHPRPVGPVRRNDAAIALVIGVPLGRLEQSALDTLVHLAESGHAAAEKDSTAVVLATPDRSIVIPRIEPDAQRRLEAAGLILDPADPRREITACIGAPGCARAEARTEPVARADAISETLATGLPVHVVACERRCGAPAGSHLELLVTRAGLRRHLRPTGARTR